MAGTTPNRALRYPLASNAPNIPQDLQNLATDIDNVFGPPVATGWVTDYENTSYNSGILTMTANTVPPNCGPYSAVVPAGRTVDVEFTIGQLNATSVTSSFALLAFSTTGVAGSFVAADGAYITTPGQMNMSLKLTASWANTGTNPVTVYYEVQGWSNGSQTTWLAGSGAGGRMRIRHRFL